MPPGFGVFVEGTGNTKKNNPELEKINSDVTIKVQILFSSISYTKFVKQKARSTKFIKSNQSGSASDYFLYCAEQWPENDGYNDTVDQVIFIDCGSDDFGSATKNSEDEKVLRKYISFAVMRLKDMCYRRSRVYGQRGKVECMVLSIFPFHKCMIAMSALLGKMLSDGDIYISFTADVLSRPEYYYTLNWIYSYGWEFNVYYNAAFSPYRGSIKSSSSPRMKMQEIDRLCNATTGFNSSWIPGNNGMPAPPYWVDRVANPEIKDGEIINVTFGSYSLRNKREEMRGHEEPVTFYNKTEKESTTYYGKKITLTEWVPQDKEEYVWVPTDPNVERWQDPKSGRCLVRLNGKIYDRDYLYDQWHSAVHPSYDELHQRIDETHKAYEEAVQREKEINERIAQTRAERNDQYTKEYIDKEVDNLVNNSGLTREQATAALAEQGFIPQNTEGDPMYFHDGRLMSDEQLTKLANDAKDAKDKAEEDFKKAQKALELRKTSDCLFILNAAALVIGIVSFGATTPFLIGAFALTDIALNVAIVGFQIHEAHVQGKSTLDAFGSSTGERAFNIGLTAVAIVADVFTFGGLFFKGKGLIHPSQAIDVKNVSHNGPLPTKTKELPSTNTAHPQASNSATDVNTPPVQRENVSSTPTNTKATAAQEMQQTPKMQESQNTIAPELEEKWKMEGDWETQFFHDSEGHRLPIVAKKEKWVSNWGGEKTVLKYQNGKTEEFIIKEGTPPQPKPSNVPEPPKNSFHDAPTEIDSNFDSINVNEFGEKVKMTMHNSDGELLTITEAKNGDINTYVDGNLFQVDSPNGEQRVIIRENGEITSIRYSKKWSDGEVIPEKTNFYKDGENIRTTLNVGDGKEQKWLDAPLEGGKIDKRGAKIEEAPSGNTREAVSSESSNKNPSGENTKSSSGDNAASSEKSGAGDTGSGNESGGSGESNAANAENADTPLVQQDKAAQEVADQADGTVSSNTGNNEKWFDNMAKKIKEMYQEMSIEKEINNVSDGMAKSLKEPLEGMVNSVKNFMNGKITGKELAKSISIDFSKAIFGLDHWICIGININNIMNIVDSSSQESIGETKMPEIEADTKKDKDTSDEFERINAELHGIKSTDDSTSEIGSLAGLDPKSLDAKAIADDTKHTMTSLETIYGKDDEMYQDYAQMNTAANDVLAAQKKVDAAKEWIRTGEEMGKVVDELGLENAIKDKGYEDLWNMNQAAAQILEDPDPDAAVTINPDTIVGITEAELKGAQVRLLYQQIIQKNHDNKQNKLANPDE